MDEKKNPVGAGFKPALAIGDEKRRRKRLRLREYDYSSVGMCFVTVCVRNHICLFGRVVEGVMRLNRLGAVVETAWYELRNHYPHVHLESALTDRTNSQAESIKRHPLSEIVRAFKTFSSRQINELRNKKEPVWQRNYYEHVIRNEESLNQIREYIETNPQRWQFDRENPNAVPAERGAGLKPAPTGIDANPGGVPPNRP